jgi:lipopolysaccharide export system permease protein
MKQLKFTILDRYLMREVLQVLLSVLLVLLLILVSNQLTRYLKNAAVGEWPTDIVLPMLGLSTVSSLTLVVPMAVFLAVILAVGRFYKDSEMTVMIGCGISQLQLYRPLGVIAVILSIIMGIFSFVVTPNTKRAAAYLEDQAVKKSEMTGLSPGRFQESNDGSRVIYVADIDDKAGQVEDIFVHSRRKDGTENLLVAETAYQQIEEGTGDTLIVLNNGYRYAGTPGTTNFRVMKYELHWLRADEGEQGTLRLKYETKPTLDLLASGNLFDWAEFHWRLAMMISPLLFTLIGLPLGRLGKREGRYGRVMVGVLIYLIYFKLLQIGHILMQKGSLPIWLGLWWVHLGLVAYLAGILYQQNSVKSGGAWARIKLLRAKDPLDKP